MTDWVHQIFVILMIVLAALVLWALGRWVLPKFGAPAIVLTCWDGIFVFLGALFLINLFLSLAGHPLVPFPK